MKKILIMAAVLLCAGIAFAVEPMANITRTDSTFDEQLAREFNNKATLNISDGYHHSSITVYF